MVFEKKKNQQQYSATMAGVTYFKLDTLIITHVKISVGSVRKGEFTLW